MQNLNHPPSRFWNDIEKTLKTFISSTKLVLCPPPCACPDCQTYYYTELEQYFDRFQYQKVITDNEARDILSQFVQQISASQEYLRQAIRESGDQILHGWRKRTQAKRSALLREAEPSLPANKYLLIDLHYSGAHWQTFRTYRKYHLLPWLDVESLVKSPAALIGLIHTRARDSPVEWAPFDYEQTRSAFRQGCFDLELIPEP